MSTAHRNQRAGIPIWAIILAVAMALALLLLLVYFLRTAESSEEDLIESRPGSRADTVVEHSSTGTFTGPLTSGAWYELGFTDPKYPDNPANHRGGLDELLVGLINRSQRTLDVAIYDFDLQNVAEAMAKASARGVRVRMVTDSDTIGKTKDKAIQDAFASISAASIPVIDDKRRPIMHDKFVVADGEWVLMGSWNFTDGDTYRLNNNTAIIQSRDLAANYTAEFEQMFGQRKFGGAKTGGAPHPKLAVAGTTIENYFCPEDKCAAQVIRWVNSAHQQIHFMAFSFTHDGIGDAMLERARNGVQVAGVFETTGSETQFSEYGRLKRAGLDVLQDGSPWTMHHKVIVIDNRVTIFGSFNFSSNADHDNDENLLIADDPSLAAAFEAEYQRVRNVALNPPARR